MRSSLSNDLTDGGTIPPNDQHTDMPELMQESVERYLQLLLGKPGKQLTIVAMSHLGGTSEKTSVKGYGYGVPVRIDYSIAGQRGSLVLHTLTPGPFGHEHMADRAHVLL